MFGACPEGAAVPEVLCSSQAQISAWACWTSLRKRRLNRVIPYGFPFLPFLVMPTHVRIDSHLYSVGVWGREGKAMCLLFLVTSGTLKEGSCPPHSLLLLCHPLQISVPLELLINIPSLGKLWTDLSSWDKSSSLDLLKAVLQTFTVIYETWSKLGLKNPVSLTVPKSLGQQQQKFVLHPGLGMWWLNLNPSKTDCYCKCSNWEQFHQQVFSFLKWLLSLFSSF